MQEEKNISFRNHPLQCSACQVSPDRQYINLVDVTKNIHITVMIFMVYTPNVLTTEWTIAHVIT